jgi:hypothetical protein
MTRYGSTLVTDCLLFFFVYLMVILTGGVDSISLAEVEGSEGVGGAFGSLIRLWKFVKKVKEDHHFAG